MDEMTAPTVEAPTEAVEAPPVDEQPVNAAEQVIELESVPQTYEVPEDISQAEDYDSELVESFSETATQARLTQRAYTDLVSWANTVEGERQQVVEKFNAYAKEKGYTKSQAEAIKIWYSKECTKRDKHAAQIRSGEITGNEKSDAVIQRIAKLSRSKAYTSKNHPKHKEVVAEVNNLFQNRT